MNRFYKAIVLFLFLFTAINIQAQTTRGWKITYQINIDTSAVAAMNDSIAVAVELAKIFVQAGHDNVMEVYVTDKKLRVVQQGIVGSIQITDKDAATSYLLYPSSNQAVRTAPATPKIVTDLTEESLLTVNSADSEIRFDSVTRTISGYQTQKARVQFKELGNADNLFVWYAPSLPKIYFGEYDYLEKIPGAPLAMFSEKTGIGLKADKIEVLDLHDSLFQIPANFEIESEYGLDASDTSEDSSAADANIVFANGYQWYDNGNRFGLMDKDEKIITKPIYTTRAPFFEGVAVVSINYLYGALDTTARQIIPYRYDFLDDAFNGFLISEKDYKYGFISTKGVEIVAPKYSTAQNFTEHLAAVSLEGKYGFIDETGKVVIPLIYDEVGYFEDGRTKVKKKGKKFWINAKGEPIK